MAARALLLAAVCLGAVVCGVSATTSFLSLGDWGDVTSAQENVIQAMVCMYHHHIHPVFPLEPSIYLFDFNHSFDDLSYPTPQTKTLRSANYSFLLGVGDNFYPRGVQSVSDSQWTSTYTSRYSDPAFNLPWLMTLGNVCVLRVGVSYAVRCCSDALYRRAGHFVAGFAPAYFCALIFWFCGLSLARSYA
jgi:hypothetical protein